MQNYSLKNAIFESGAWAMNTKTLTSPNNTNIGNDTNGGILVVPLKKNAYVYAPSVGTWIDGNGKNRDIDLTMYVASDNGGGISNWYGATNTLSFVAGRYNASKPKDKNGKYSITFRCVFSFHDTKEKVPDNFCGVTGFNDLDGAGADNGFAGKESIPSEGMECLSGFNAQYMMKNVNLASYGTNGWGGTQCDAGDESKLDEGQQLLHRYSATWEGPEITIRYTSGVFDYAHTNFATPILYDTSAYKINLKIVDESNKTLQENQVVAQAKLGSSWDVSGSLPSISGYTYSRLADGSDPLSGTIGASNQRDQNIVLVYTENKYTVKFVDGYDGTVIKTEQVKKGNDATPPSPLPTHKGYIHKIWDKSYTNVTGDITVTMPYRPIVYTIKYDPNGATGGTMPDKEMEYGKTGNLDANQFERRGYSFAGWKNGNRTYADGAEIANLSETDNDTVTMSAQWTPISYRIVFDKNRSDATGTTEAMDMKYGATKALTPNGYTSVSSKFTTWNTKSDGSGKTYSNKQEVKNLVETDGGVVTLYAQWSTNAYTVTFVDGHNGQTIKQESVQYGGAATAPAIPKHEGYTSTQWDNDFNNVTSNTTTTIGYIANEYTINFDGNRETGGNMQPLHMQYDKEKNLTANAFTREGYTWVGWNTKAGGNGTGYTDKQAVRNLTSENNGRVTLYAQWTPIAYRIQFDKNRTDATGETAPMEMTFDVAKNLTANGFTSPSSKFNCWNSKPDGSGQAYANGQSVKNLTKAPNDIVTLYAQWNTNSYTVTFVDGHDGKTISTPSVKYGGNATPPTKPVHEGYTATTWGGNYQNVTHDETVTLQYRPNDYKIAFKPNGGTGNMADQQMKYDKAKALNRNAFTRTGYTFTGWKEQDAGIKHADGETVKNLTSIDGDTVTLLAQWEANGYIIKYNANGGTGNMADQQMKYDTPVQLTANAYRKTGYTFTGWRRDDKATGTKYRNRETVTNLLSANGATTTMYAQWKANEYTVTFIDGHDGKTISTETVTYGSNATEPNKPAHEGYTATTWDKPLSNITGDTVITLAYRPNVYTIRLDKNASDATGSTADKRMEYDKAGSLTRNGYFRAGYTWLGWSSSADGNGTMYSDGQSVVNLTSEDGGTVTLYAVWKINRYTVTFIDGKTGDVIARQETDYGGNATMPAAPSHDGYKPNGWNSNGKNITKDTTITLSYQPISYQIAFDKNSGEASGTMPNQQMKYDQWANLDRNAFSRPGYRFAGWDTHRGTGTSYEDGERVRNLSETDGDVITLYARWIEDDHISISYKVESDDGKGENEIDNAYDDMNPTTGVPKGSTATASKEYNFIGWYGSDGKPVSSDAKFIPSKPAGGKWIAVSYTAKFKRKAFTVSFVGKDGGELKTEKVPYGDPATAPDAPTINGYEFAGWDTAFDSVTSDLTVTAVYRELPKPAPQPEQPAPTQPAPQPAPQPEQKGETVDGLIQTGIDIAPVIAIPAIAAALIAFSIARRKRK